MARNVRKMLVSPTFYNVFDSNCSIFTSTCTGNVSIVPKLGLLWKKYKLLCLLLGYFDYFDYFDRFPGILDALSSISCYFNHCANALGKSLSETWLPFWAKRTSCVVAICSVLGHVRWAVLQATWPTRVAVAKAVKIMLIWI